MTGDELSGFLNLGGCSAGTVGAGGIDYIDELLEVLM